MSRFEFRAVLCSLLVLGAAFVAAAEPQALLRIDRPEAATRELLLGAGVAVVAELEQAVLAVGPAAVVEADAAGLGLSATVLDPAVEGMRYALAGLREGATIADLAGCGELLWQEDSWILVRDPQLEDPACMGSTRFMMTPLRLDAVRPAQPPPAGFDGFAGGEAELLDPDPLVVDMLTQLDTGFALAHWQGVVGAASTRYSTSTGCQTAATYVYNLFDALGLNPEYQPHTGGHAPNVIGTIPGRSTPEQVYILIGHLDDMPSSGPAPGADDNASGTAMVTALAELMADYDFASTVKFIAVTGEEFGLYGSEYYAAGAAVRGREHPGRVQRRHDRLAGQRLAQPREPRHQLQHRVGLAGHAAQPGRRGLPGRPRGQRLPVQQHGLLRPLAVLAAGLLGGLRHHRQRGLLRPGRQLPLLPHQQRHHRQLRRRRAGLPRRLDAPLPGRRRPPRRSPVRAHRGADRSDRAADGRQPDRPRPGRRRARA